MRKAAVIGGGPMGLATAYHLQRGGYEVSLYEADKVLGGMSASFDFGGLLLERYYHFICKTDYPLFELLGELGLAERMRWTETRMGFYYNGRLHEWGNPVALLKFDGLDFISRIRYGLMALVSTKRKDWSGLDRIDAVTWIVRWIGRRAYDVLWKPLFEYKFYQHTENISAAWIWSRVRRIGLSRKNMMVETLGHIDGGTEVLIQRLSDEIQKMGGKVSTSAAVTEVVVENGAVKGIIVDGQLEPFDVVVSTVPTPYLSALIPALPEGVHEQLGAIANIPVVCVVAKLRKPCTGNFWLNINDPGMDIPGIIEYSNLRNMGDAIVYVPYYMPEDNGKFLDPDEVFLGKSRDYIKRINSEITDEDFIDIRVFRNRYAQVICEPGFREKLPPVDLPVKGLYAADTAYYYPEDRGVSESVGLGREISRMVIEGDTDD